MFWSEVLAAAVPFASLREFGRRFAFAHMRVLQSLMLALAASAVQLCGLVWLGSTGRLSAVTACAAIGVAYALPSVAWLYLFPRQLCDPAGPVAQDNASKLAIRQMA